jgi:hypothetical protein
VGKITGIESVRARELGRLFDHRYGPTLPDDDAGLDDARLMLSQLITLPHASERVQHFLDLRCPWLVGEDRDREVEAAFRNGPARLTADEIAVRLGVDIETRSRLRLTTIGAVDRDSAARKEDRRRRRAAAEKERRARKARAKAAVQGTDVNNRKPENGRTAYIRGILRDPYEVPVGEWLTAGEIENAARACLSPFAKLSPQAIQRAVSRALKILAGNGEIETKSEKGKTGFPVLSVRYRGE